MKSIPTMIYQDKLYEIKFIIRENEDTKYSEYTEYIRELKRADLVINQENVFYFIEEIVDLPYQEI